MRYLILPLPALCAAQSLQVYAIDMEGGKSTLFISPSGQTMLVDTGYTGFNGRDAGRISAAAADAGVKRIDYLLITHYHVDHLGGVPQLIARLPVGTFVDHGPNFETAKDTRAVLNAYIAERAGPPNPLCANYRPFKPDTGENAHSIGATHHGTKTSGSPRMVDALHPKVAIMNNGPVKGGSAQAWQTNEDGSFTVRNGRNGYQKTYP